MTNKIELPDLLSAVSDQQSVEMLKTITESQGQTKIAPKVDQTPRMYYTRLTKLRETSQIKQVGTQKFRPTLLGKILNELLETAQEACDLSWNLSIIDELLLGGNAKVPESEKDGLIESLIPDGKIRQMIFEERAKES